MATVRKLGRPHGARLLAPLQVIGRAPSCRLTEADGHVSGVHAELRWDGARWLVEDLGSRNGTWVGGQRLRPRSPVVVAAGARIAVGRPENVWHLETDDAPEPMAERQDGSTLIAHGDCLALPDQEAPDVVVYRGHTGGWTMDSPEGTSTVRNGAVITVRGEAWTLHLPDVLSPTLTLLEETPTPRTVRLRLVVYSQEQAEAWMIHGSNLTQVGPRATHQLLCALADARLRDQAAGLHPTEQGWIPQAELARGLGVQGNALNVAVHRLRRQFAHAGLEEAVGVVERRSTQAQLRLGIQAIEKQEG